MDNKEERLRKPKWIRVHLPANNSISRVKSLLRNKHQCTVCEEAACPNLAECFNRKTATFMIMGDLCTRDCQFCNVKHGKPRLLNPEEPQQLAEAVKEMELKYVVITSVTRDDLPDGGAAHYTACIQALRQINQQIKIEILTPDFRGCLDDALITLAQQPSDIFNHNIETAPRLYPSICPQADYQLSLTLLKRHKEKLPHIPTKSGMMLGLGETKEEVEQVLHDLRHHYVDMLTLGQYLQPSRSRARVQRYVTPDEFAQFRQLALKMGFKQAASGPLVRSSYHAENQTAGELVK